VASGAGLDVRDAQEANVFRLAGMVLGSVRPAEAARLRRASGSTSATASRCS